MKNIYTFGRKPAQRNFTVKDLQDLKGSGKRLTANGRSYSRLAMWSEIA